MLRDEIIDRFTAATWDVEERTPGHWWVVETLPGSYTQTQYGPMWAEMVEPLIDELREIVRCSLARARGSLIYGSPELRMPYGPDALQRDAISTAAKGEALAALMAQVSQETKKASK